jgi:hypothetical protein
VGDIKINLSIITLKKLTWIKIANSYDKSYPMADFEANSIEPSYCESKRGII